MPDIPGVDEAYESAVPLGSEDFDDEPAGQEETGGSLRRKLEESLARVKELEDEKATEVGDLQGQLMANEYDRLGLDPSRGIGKAAALVYDGDPAGLAEFVEAEFDYTGAEPKITEVIANEYARLDQASATAGSVPVVPTQDDALARAEAVGDYQTTLEIKSNQIARMLQP